MKQCWKSGRVFAKIMKASVASALCVVAAVFTLCCTTGCDQIFGPSDDEVKELLLEICNEKLSSIPATKSLKAVSVSDLSFSKGSGDKYSGTANVEIMSPNTQKTVSIPFDLKGEIKSFSFILRAEPSNEFEAGIKLLAITAAENLLD